MPSKSFNKNWDVEDPNAEIPHLSRNRAETDELEMGTNSKLGSESQPVTHVEHAPKV